MISPKDYIASKLRTSIQQCSIRCLHQSASWAAEQLIGLEDDQGNTIAIDESATNIFSHEEVVGANEIGVIMLSSSLLSMGQYQRCAHNLRSEGSRKIRSSLGIFMYAYSQYLAGEKQRAQQKDEKEKRNEGKTQLKNKKHDGFTDSDIKIKNPYLQQLYGDLLPIYSASKMDSFMLYIFAVITKDLHEQYGKPLEVVLEGGRKDSPELEPYQLFIQSLANNPWNWSCWLELAKYCLDKHHRIPTWDEICSKAPTSLQPLDKQCGRTMFAFFMSHIYLEKHRGDLALQAMEKLHKIFPTSLHLYTHVGVAYYSQRLYDQAENCFEIVRNKDPFRLEHVDTYSNILYVKEKTAELSYLAHSVVAIEKFSPEVCCVVGNYYSLKGQHERAVTYFQRALRLDSSYLSAWTLMGHEFMELRNTAAAVQCYRNAVEISEGDYRAWYGLGQTYEMLHLYQYAYYYFKKAAFLRPSDARMWSAVGNCLLKLGMKTEAIATYERAVNSGDREGIATRDLARLYREEGQSQQAAELYYKYLQCNIFATLMNNQGNEEVSTLPSTIEGLIADLNESRGSDYLQLEDSKYGSIDNVHDSEQAEAILFLASYFNSLKQPRVAEFFCTRLLSFTGPEGDEARIMLKDLRTNHQEPSFSFQSSRKKEPVFGERSDLSPVASPWKRYGTHDGHSAPPLSSIRNPRRESTGSALDPFDRFLANNANNQHDDDIAEGNEEESVEQERSTFQFSRDDSQMSVDSPFDQRK